jgi:type VI secretion system secreted protein Hcp
MSDSEKKTQFQKGEQSMRILREKKLFTAGGMIVVFCALLVSSGHSGNLEPASAPAPTMHTLDEIYTVASTLDKPVGPLAGAKVRTAAYMQITGPAVGGEAADPAHLNWIDILWSSHRLEQRVSEGSGARVGSKVNFSEFRIIKEIDKSSPTLYSYCAQGRSFASVVIEYTKNAAGSKVYLKITMTNVLIGSISPVMTYRSNGEYTHLEDVTFRYKEISWNYNQYNEAGELVNTVETGYKVTANKPL